MRDPLDIIYPSFKSFTITAADHVLRAGEKLLSTGNLPYAFELYNLEICSLSYMYPGDGLHCNGQYDDFHGDGKVFFRKSGRDDPGFEVFLQERQKEVDRLVSKISMQSTYDEQLACLIECRAGQLRPEYLVIESNEWVRFISDGGGTTPDHLLGRHVLIDLTPSSAEQRASYNRYIRKHVQQIIDTPQPLHWLVPQEYKGFRMNEGLKAFHEQLARALDREESIRAEVRRLERHFDYPNLVNYLEFLYPYSIKDISLWQSAVFASFRHGHIFDERRIALNVDEMKAFVHVQELYAYYKEVHGLLSKPGSKVSTPPMTDNDGMKKMIETIMDGTRLSDFLSVPAPDLVLEHAFWHDVHDQPVECNIYHHKYGYKGFETTSAESLVTSFLPVTSYQDPISRKYVYCQYYLPMLCTADEVSFFNKDGQQVTKVPFVQTNKRRQATNAADFLLICDREFAAKSLSDTRSVRLAFFEELQNHTLKLIEQHRATMQYANGLDIALIALAHEFIDYLARQIQQLKNAKGQRKARQPTREITGLFCRLLDQAGIRSRAPGEGIEEVCRRICIEFKLTYSDKVRQHYSNSENNRNLRKVIEELQPKLSAADGEVLQNYIKTLKAFK
jgi:hypothetical protein